MKGTVWYAGIAAYGMADADLGVLDAMIGWPLFMATLVIVANLWGRAAAGEWTDDSRLAYSYSQAVSMWPSLSQRGKR